MELIQQGSDLCCRQIGRRIRSTDLLEDVRDGSGMQQDGVVGASMVEGTKYPEVLGPFFSAIVNENSFSRLVSAYAA